MSDWSATVAFFRILLVMCLPIAEARAMQVATGSFSGDGTTSQAITGLGFAPEVVILRTLGAGNSTRFRSATMLTGSKTLIENAALEGGWITSLDSDGFTVGDAARINDIGWESHWIAFTGTDDGFAVGSYIGDGASTDVDISDTSSSPDFQPSYLILVADTGIAPVQRFDDGTDSSSHLFGFNGAPVSDGNVTDLTPTGFIVTPGDRTNASGIDYHYVAWRERDGTEVGTYTGHGVGGATIPVPFPPSFASISRGICCVQSIFRIGSQIADQSSFYSPIDEVDDGIKSFTAGGFVIGDHASVASAQKHFFVAFGSATSPVPAISAGLLALLAVAIAVAGATYRVHQA